MTNFLDSALECAARGWYVLPLRPRDKSPIIPKSEGGSGYKDARLDPETIKAWWTRWPNANIGIATGASNKCVMDCDHGLSCYEDFIAWRDRNGIPVTYTVRSGRRVSKEDGVTPVFNVQMYFDGAIDYNGRFDLDGVSGEIRSSGALVVAVGSIHPDSGQTYEVLIDSPTVSRPPQVEQSATRAKNAELQREPGEKVKEGRNNALTSEIGKFRHRNPGVSRGMTLAAMLTWNDENCYPPLSEAEVQETVAKQFRQYEDTLEAPGIVVKKPDTPVITDWREHYHTLTEHDSVGPPRFLIEGFLPEQAIMGIGAFVGQKKTLAALNIVFSLCSGEPLFGKYKVTRKPTRVLYLGPENGLISFSDRVNRIGLRDYLCKTFFYSTMSMQEKRPLTALMPEEIQDAVIVIDTAIRFTDGNENDAAMMKEFADHAFSLIRNNASGVIMLHHSPKTMTKANELTLENSFRGTGELSAFLSVALAMRTQDMDNEYESSSLLRFVKQRDFQPQPSSFEVQTSRDTCRMTFVDGSNGATVSKKTTADADGKEEAALQVLRDNPSLSHKKLSLKLKEMGIKRGPTWVGNKRFDLGFGGVKTGSV